MRISEAFSAYVKDYLTIRGVNPNTIVHYQATARLFCEIIGNKHISQIKVSDISEWASKLRNYGHHRCDNTIRSYVSIMRVVLRYWRARGLNCLNPDLVPSMKRRAVIPTYITAEEVQAMINHSSTYRSRFIISLLYSSGIRLSEMLNLNRDQIINREFTVIGKGQKVRLCFIDSRTEYLMHKYLDWRDRVIPSHCDAMFVTQDGQRRMTATNVQLAVKNAARNAGIKKHVTPHTLRHSFATNYAMNDGNMRYLQQLLGHSNLQTTAHYTHIVDSHLREQYEKSHTF